MLFYRANQPARLNKATGASFIASVIVFVILAVIGGLLPPVTFICRPTARASRLLMTKSWPFGLRNRRNDG